MPPESLRLADPPTIDEKPERPGTRPEPEIPSWLVPLKDLLQQILEALSSGRGIEAELIPAPETARLAGLGVATWHRIVAAGKTPLPVRLGGAVRWRKSELLAWIESGCPDRKTWESLRGKPRR